jgi:hypothetical protein
LVNADKTPVEGANRCNVDVAIAIGSTVSAFLPAASVGIKARSVSRAASNPERTAALPAIWKIFKQTLAGAPANLSRAMAAVASVDR